MRLGHRLRAGTPKDFVLPKVAQLGHALTLVDSLVEGHSRNVLAHLDVYFEKLGLDGEIGCVDGLVTGCESECEVKLVDLEHVSLGAEGQMLWCDKY